ncbi:hypothetical protein BDZ89DRAFT_1068734 [Hymenopellis radicata]|nr:hypothetical protein BDZ89DRAFT_1068734 [Hymenopellis radicata]
MSHSELAEPLQPAWNVLESLRSGHNPLMATASGIADRVVALETRQKEYEADITRLEQTILQRRAAIALTVTEIQQTKSLAAPIRTIPVKSFFASFPSSILGHVCRLWRTLSRSAPSLWSNISLYRSTRRFVGYWDDVLEQHLFLSNPRPLDIYMEYPALAASHLEEHDVEILMSTLSGHSSRWRSFEIYGSEVVLKEFFNRLASGIHFNTLESLKVLYRRSPGSPADLGVFDVSLPPTLTSLDMNFAFETLGKLTPHWSALTSVSVPFSGPGSFYQFIVDARNLVSLHISCIANEESEVLLLPFIHPKLCRLTLDTPCSISPVLDQISLPNLSELHLQSHGCQSQKKAEERLCRLVQRSRCELKVLSLNCTFALSDLIPILQLPSLVSLRVHLDVEVYSGAATSALLDTLTVAPTKQVLPGLRELEITTNTLIDFLFPHDRLPAMILSRWNVPKNVARLSKLTLSREDYPEPLHPIYNTSALAFFLWDLEDKGLEVSWTMEGDNLLAQGREYARSVF